MATKQETFDLVVGGLLAQGRKSEKYERGMIRGPGGTKCSLGFLIPDERYDERLDSGPCRPALDLCEELGHDRGLARALMHVHDNSPPDAWGAALERVAVKFGLDYSPPAC